MLRHRAKLLRCLVALRADPKDVDALFTLGVIYASEGHVAKALKYLRKVEAVDPFYPGLEHLKGRVIDSIPEGLRGGAFTAVHGNR
ncbi:MAG: tetratricopeptide repeat protein [Thermoplasmata archaeon]